MATLTIRNVPDEVKHELRLAAAARGVSMEQEARDRLAKREISRDAARKATSEELLALGRSLLDGPPLDPRFRTLSQKEISDLVSDGEL